jgi:hypothetical protein
MRAIIGYLNPDKQEHVYEGPVARPGLYRASQLPPIIRRHQPRKVGGVAFPVKEFLI